MEEHLNPGEQITSRLLATEEDYISSVTGVLLFSCFIAVCGSFNYGLAVGFTSPVESEIIDDLGLSTAEYSLFGSFLTFGGALGSLACGKMSDYLGRRWTFGVTDVFSIAGWFAILASQSVFPLYAGRVLLGFALGVSNYVIPIYIAEITPKDFRGRFVTLHMAMICGGIASAYVLGFFIPWRALAALGILLFFMHHFLFDYKHFVGISVPSLAAIVPNLAQLLGIFFIPESPRWLVKVHKESEFIASLLRLRGSNAGICTEAADIKEYTEALEQIPKVSIFKLFQRKYAYALTVGIGIFALSQLDGTNGIIYYASSIFESAGFSSELGSIIMAAVQVVSVVISLHLMDRVGRRPLLMVSAVGLCLANLLPGISFVMQDRSWLEGFSPYLALVGILMYCAFYAIGIGGISYLLIAEIYPINIKGLAGSVATFVGWLTSWFVSYTFNFSMEWSSAGTFFILTGICVFTLVFVVMLVPETKGRTLEEIQVSTNQMFHTSRKHYPNENENENHL